MEILNQPAEMQRLTCRWRCAGQSVGFVPTMGALHAGHLELCRRARAENDRFVASVFVNPKQFGAGEDLSKYPRPFESDCDLLREAGCDAVFAPDVSAMYGESQARRDKGAGCWVEVTPLDGIWEGVTRPGHIRGMATVVAKLFNIAHPHRAYFGEKDFQQLRVVEMMVRDLNFDLEIVPVPTLREPDGLAMSSRNAYLAQGERAAAAALYRAMQAGAERATQGECDVLKLGQIIGAELEAEPLLRPQYVAIVDAQTLEVMEQLGDRPARVLVAAFVGKTRLIDNIAIG